MKEQLLKLQTFYEKLQRQKRLTECTALSLLAPDEICWVVLKKTGLRREAVWASHTQYFQFLDEPPGIAEPHEINEWWPVDFTKR